jgi:MoaA/NifB/PqqE/SkfB family radical SAM enzyme
VEFRLLKKRTQPDLDWIQVEITTKCDGECIYCPHIFFNKTENMSLDTFRNIIPYFKNTGLIYLQGWGEPLLNENIFQMIHLCKIKGKQVGFTTNGMSLDEKAINALVKLKLDIISTSLAGTTSDTHDRLRKGTTFEKIISNLLLLRQIKEKHGSVLPRLHIAYIMLRSNFDEIKNLVSLAKKLDAKQIVASNLTFIVQKNLYEEPLFNNINNCGYYNSILKQHKENALKKGIIFDYREPVLHNSFQQCGENVNYSSVIDVKGNVSPCVFTMPSLRKSMKPYNKKNPLHYFKGKIYPISEINFGNIKNEGLIEIWKRKRYADFRDFANRSSKSINNSSCSDSVDCCTKCYKSLSV